MTDKTTITFETYGFKSWYSIEQTINNNTSYYRLYDNMGYTPHPINDSDLQYYDSIQEAIIKGKFMHGTEVSILHNIKQNKSLLA